MGLSYDRNNSSWIAHVAGTQDYYVDIQLENLNQGSINTYCECPAFDTYGSCKHIVAVLLAVQENLREKEKKINHNPRLVQEFFDKVMLSQEMNSGAFIEKIPMKVEYYIVFDFRKVYLQIKTGIEHCYVVRDIRSLLESVLNNETHYFTNKFSYEPQEHYFFQQDLEVFQQLYDILMTSDFLTDNNYYSRSTDKRSLLIPPLSVKNVMEKLIERQLIVETRNGIYKEVEMIIDESPIHYAVSRSKEANHSLVLKMEGITDAKYFEEYNMFFKEGTFYFPSKTNYLFSNMQCKLAFVIIYYQYNQKILINFSQK